MKATDLNRLSKIEESQESSKQPKITQIDFADGFAEEVLHSYKATEKNNNLIWSL